MQKIDTATIAAARKELGRFNDNSKLLAPCVRRMRIDTEIAEQITKNYRKQVEVLEKFNESQKHTIKLLKLMIKTESQIRDPSIQVGH